MTGFAAVEEYQRRFDERISRLVFAAADRSPGFARRLEQAGLRPADIDGVAALDRLPLLTKDELVDQQHRSPPFGDLLAKDAVVRRVFQSPGPLYEPELDREDPWRWGAALTSAGIGGDDLVVNCFGYHLTPAGAMFEEACRSLGVAVLPGGVGSVDLQARACAALGVTAYIGLPSYLKALLEKAEELELDLALRVAVVTAEPLPASLRAWLTERVPNVRQAFGTAETGNLGYESDRQDGFHVPDDALLQICDLTTGEAVTDDREGQVVVTLLDPDYPLVRFGIGDLSAWADPAPDEPAPTPRIRGWLGRVGDAVKVRGMFLHPRQVVAVMEDISGVSRYRFVIDRAEHRDALRCEVVPAAGSDVAQVSAQVRRAVRAGLRFDVEVSVVDDIAEEEKPILDVRTWS